MKKSIFFVIEPVGIPKVSFHTEERAAIHLIPYEVDWTFQGEMLIIDIEQFT